MKAVTMNVILITLCISIAHVCSQHTWQALITVTMTLQQMQRGKSDKDMDVELKRSCVFDALIYMWTY